MDENEYWIYQERFRNLSYINIFGSGLGNGCNRYGFSGYLAADWVTDVTDMDLAGIMDVRSLPSTAWVLGKGKNN